MASTAGATLFVIMASLLFNINQIQNRSEEGGVANPTDQILYANQLLEASLLGKFLNQSLIPSSSVIHLLQLSILMGIAML